ncbi:MAG: fliO [Frankiales bacterium]|nr:fliO [Frankiales bacterium]
MNAVELIGRTLLALLVVLGIMWALAKFARKPLTGMTGRSDKVLTVLARQQLNRNASVAVLKVGDKAIVVGVSDGGVRLLSETDAAPFEAALAAGRPEKTTRAVRGVRGSRTRPPPKRRALPRGAPMPAPTPMTMPLSRSVDSVTDNTAEVTDDVALPAYQSDARGALDGSVLSPKVWKQLLDGARELTVRR